MQQSNFIFGALAVAFVIFATMRGSLPIYMSVFFGTAKAGGDGAANAVAAEAKASGTTAEQAFGFLQSGAIPGLKIPGMN